VLPETLGEANNDRLPSIPFHSCVLTLPGFRAGYSHKGWRPLPGFVILYDTATETQQ